MPAGNTQWQDSWCDQLLLTSKKHDNSKQYIVKDLFKRCADDAYSAECKVCRKRISIKNNGLFALNEHHAGDRHIANLVKLSGQSTLSSMFSGTKDVSKVMALNQTPIVQGQPLALRPHSEPRSGKNLKSDQFFLK